MKVKIGPYTSWYGPYQLAKTLMFWVPEEKDEHGVSCMADRVHKFGEWLAHGSIEPETKVGEVTPLFRDRPTTWIAKFLSWIESKKKRTIKVKIDRWDTWNMDETLAHIILPMLKQLKETKHGSPHVDMEDVPESLRYDTTEDYESQLCFDWYHDESTEKKDCNVHTRWEWVLNEMIFAFESYFNDWDEKYCTGEHDMLFKQLDGGMSQLVRGPNDTFHCDYEGMKKESDRINNGLMLFGKYYKGLWD